MAGPEGAEREGSTTGIASGPAVAARGLGVHDLDMVGLSQLPPAVRAAVERFAREARTCFGARLLDVRVFGSYARGEAREESDLDLFVLIEGMTPRDQREAIDLATGISADQGFRLRLSPLAMDRALFDKWRRQERRLVLDIEREGIPA